MLPQELDKTIAISSILVTQSSIRTLERVRKMVEFVRRGGHFTPDRVAEFHAGEANQFGLIVLSRFPCGRIYLHDGHHRSISAYLGGRKYFAFEERLIIEWDSLDRYNEINPAKGWVTPLDLLKEVRLPDILEFKKEALALSGEFQTEFIRRNRHRYSMKREVDSVAELGNFIWESDTAALAA